MINRVGLGLLLLLGGGWLTVRAVEPSRPSTSLFESALWRDAESSPFSRVRLTSGVQPASDATQPPLIAQPPSSLPYDPDPPETKTEGSQLEPEALMREVFPDDEHSRPPTTRYARPGTSYWVRPADAPELSWSERDVLDQQLSSWFATLDVAIVKPHLQSALNSGTLLNPTFADPLQLPATPLHITGMPTLTIGKKTPGSGEGWQLRYRSLYDGGQEATNTAGVDSHGRLALHVIDLDYLNGCWKDDPEWGLDGTTHWTLGIRASAMNTRYSLSGLPTPDSQRASDQFAGAGPHVGWIREVPLRRPGWYGVLELDAAGQAVSDRQHFERIDNLGVLQASGSRRSTTGIATAGARGMLRWDRQCFGRPWTVSGGYVWERWWFLGDTANNSNLELTIQGPFVRGETRF